MQRMWTALAIVAAGVGLALWFWPASAESLIRRELKGLVESVEKAGPESPVAAAARARSAAGRFVGQPEIRFDLLPGAVETRDDLVAAVFHARTQVETVRVETYGDDIDVEPGSTSAVQRLSARAAVVHGGEPEQVIREFELRWVRTPEGWRIAAARELQAIRPVP